MSRLNVTDLVVTSFETAATASAAQADYSTPECPTPATSCFICEATEHTGCELCEETRLTGCYNCP